MPRSAIDATVDHIVGNDTGGERYIDLRVDWLACECFRCLPHLRPEQRDAGPIITAGGVWDRVTKSYSAEGDKSKIFRMHPGQLEAAEWFAEWRAARHRGEHLYESGEQVVTLMLHGGRRGGKSVLGFRAGIEFAIEVPKSIVWIIIPEYHDLPELRREVESHLPRAWYQWLGDPWFAWYLPNGSEIQVKSSHIPEDLKQGRCDLAIFNEAQKHKQEAYVYVLPGLADTGGLCILTFNPPRSATGWWVDDLLDKALAGSLGAKSFCFDPQNNPHVDRKMLLALEHHMDERTFRMEILGERLPREDVVMYSFSPSFNVQPTPADEYDVTPAFTERLVGRSHKRGHGLDFQITPHMAWVTGRVFMSVDDPVLWITHANVIEQGVEEDVVDDLERNGFTLDDALIPDASGEFQDAERTKGRRSMDVFRRRGWRHIYLPVAGSKKNPPKDDRLSLGNALFRSAAGVRRAFVDPRCVHLIRALKMWENKNGIPNWRSSYAHLVDALTYLMYRWFPPQAVNEGFEYARVSAGKPRRRAELEDFED